MRFRLGCLPCAVKQAYLAVMASGAPAEVRVAAARKAALVAGETPVDQSPAEFSHAVLRAAYDALGTSDPYASRKAQANREVLALWPSLERFVAEAEDPLRAALLLSVAGNVIDLGTQSEYDLEGAIDQAVAEGFKVDDYDQLRQRLGRARQVLFLTDNCGEIVLDKLLVREMSRLAPVVIAVKGAPIINDATLADAEAVGLAEVAPVISNGCGALGTVPDQCSAEFRAALAGADLVFAKGQANFETLQEADAVESDIFFLLRAKCEFVAEELGVGQGDAVLYFGRQGGGRR